MPVPANSRSFNQNTDIVFIFGGGKGGVDYFRNLGMGSRFAPEGGGNNSITCKINDAAAQVGKMIHFHKAASLQWIA